MDDEIWKPVPIDGFGDYYDVSTKGRVRSHGFNRRNRLMTLETNNRGYVRVRLYDHGGYVRYYVHRLVAMAFLDNPNNCDQVNHKNLDRADNRLENLEWVNASENQSHKTRYRDEKIKMLEERIDQLKSIIKTENNKTGDIVAHDAHADDYKQAAEYWQRMYEETFAERTCRDTGENEWHFVCSACGYEQNGYECWNYCPNCGAKVMDE